MQAPEANSPTGLCNFIFVSVVYSLQVMMGVLNRLSTLFLLSLLPPALSRVVEKFSDVPECEKFFLGGTTPNLPDILVNGTVQNQGQNQNRYKPICQKYKTIYRFATLYDTFNRIPVFSAYNFTGPGCNRTSQTWKIEPQLDKNIEEMKTQHEVKLLNNNIDIEEINTQSKVKKLNNINDIVNQAVNTDYNYNDLGLDRGHLFPCSHAPDNDTMRSTFTLTNAVPQESCFNKGRWCKMEVRVRNYLLNNCKNNNNKIEAYVVTGAVPNNNTNNHHKLNNRVNIPDILWTAFCCFNSEKDKWMAGAHWGWNKKKDLNTEVLGPHPLTDLYVMLNDRYRVDGVQVFPDQCSNVDIPTELLLKDGGDEHDHCVCVPTEEPLIKNTCSCHPRKRKCNLGDDGGDMKRVKFQKRDIPRALPLKDGGDEHDHCVYDDDCVCSSVGVKGYYLPVVFVSVLVMMM